MGNIHFFLISLLAVALTRSFSKAFSPYSLNGFRKNFIGTTNRKQEMSKMASEERSDDSPIWDPEQQIYVGGKLPENEEVKALLDSSDGSLRLFGYGSLCWNPGTGALAKQGVVSKLGRAKGYKRCWAQRSTDHRGNPKFPGIVCTLLEDKEVHSIRALASDDNEEVAKATMTEGVIYWIPPELVNGCLEELDFREKGGYARETISVVEDESGETHRALLYRGTPDSPAFWNRVLLDLPLAAAIMSVSEGPSGLNTFYLNNLDKFLTNTHSIDAENDDTTQLANMVRYFQKNSSLYFCYGSGSNQHNQLLLDRPKNAACLRNGEDAHEKKEIVLCTERGSEYDKTRQIYAGGGHSGLLTESGNLFLWGWNEDGQCATSGEEEQKETSSPLPNTRHLADISVEIAALGFSHTLVIEKETNHLFAFGNNERGQVNGSPSKSVSRPVTPDFLINEQVQAIAAGLFHSAAITHEGELVTFGCGRFGQSLSSVKDDGNVWVGRWKPDDGVPLVDVACGRRHTVVVDKIGRVWTFGENKYGQLGRAIEGKKDPVPALADSSEFDFPEGSDVRVDCGWSHALVHVLSGDGALQVYGWGRNDKGQLGTGTRKASVSSPTRLFKDKKLSSIACGSEFIIALEQESNHILGCGWNEHGNLATCSQDDQLELTKTHGTKVYGPPGLHDGKIIMAVGGAHFFATMI
jgi:alpha-tubulin suppressor-like RCC1 family protein/cation transport regulator ChaC